MRARIDRWKLVSEGTDAESTGEFRLTTTVEQRLKLAVEPAHPVPPVPNAEARQHGVWHSDHLVNVTKAAWGNHVAHAAGEGAEALPAADAVVAAGGFAPHGWTAEVASAPVERLALDC